jgi:hypothetical protein
MRAKSTTSQGKEHEEFIVDLFEWANAWRSKSSGSSFHAPVDVTTDVSVIECESTEAKSYRLTLDFWREVERKQHTGKLPMLAVRFRDPANGKHVDLLVLNAHDGTTLLEEVEAYRDDSVSVGSR